jgi:hypothetical protein
MVGRRPRYTPESFSSATMVLTPWKNPWYLLVPRNCAVKKDEKGQ